MIGRGCLTLSLPLESQFWCWLEEVLLNVMLLMGWREQELLERIQFINVQESVTVLYSTVLYCIVLYCTVCLDVWPGWGKTVQRGARMGIFQQQNCAQGWELIKIFHTVKLFYFNSTTVAGAAIISIQWRNGLKMSLKQVNCWLKFNFIW